MSDNWEIKRVSTPERICQKITERMPQPVSIMLFGADGEFKKETIEKLQQRMPEAKWFYGAPSTHEMVELIHSSPVSIFVLSSMESSDHELRHECVNVMRRIGTKTVVGFYAKAKPPQPLPGCGFPGRPDLQLMWNTVRKLEQHPPTAHGLDYLITDEQ